MNPRRVFLWCEIAAAAPRMGAPAVRIPVLLKQLFQKQNAGSLALHKTTLADQRTSTIISWPQSCGCTANKRSQPHACKVVCIAVKGTCKQQRHGLRCSKLKMRMQHIDVLQISSSIKRGRIAQT